MKRRFAMIVLVALTLVGCSTNVGDPVVDGWPIGRELSCDADARCPELLATANDALDQRDLGHAAVVKVTLHAEGTIMDANGSRILQTRSGGCCAVALFELADASVKAIGVGAVGVDPTIRAFDYGP